MRTPFRKSNVFLILTAVILQGCAGRSSQTTVFGTVTFAGREIPKGFITFFQAGGSQSQIGAEIVNGRYELVGITPGEKRVLITAYPKEQVIDREHGQALIFIPDPPVLPNSDGNYQIVNIVAGKQNRDFHLRKLE